VQNEGASTVDEVVKIISPDPATFGGLFVVTAILAPVLEEFVFRGFLLVSFTKFMPVNPPPPFPSRTSFRCISVVSQQSAVGMQESTSSRCRGVKKVERSQYRGRL